MFMFADQSLLFNSVVNIVTAIFSKRAARAYYILYKQAGRAATADRQRESCAGCGGMRSQAFGGAPPQGGRPSDPARAASVAKDHSVDVDSDSQRDSQLRTGAKQV